MRSTLVLAAALCAIAALIGAPTAVARSSWDVLLSEDITVTMNEADVYRLDASGGNFTVTLPDLSNFGGYDLDWMRVDPSPNLVTIQTSVPGQIVLGAPSVTIAAGHGIHTYISATIYPAFSMEGLKDF